jgi:hypothetical protein
MTHLSKSFQQALKEADNQVKQSYSKKKHRRSIHDHSSFGIGWKRIWHYVSPKFLGICMVLISIVAACAWPVLGLIVSKVQFVMIDIAYTHSEEAIS